MMAAEDCASSLRCCHEHDISDAVRVEAVEDFEPFGECKEHMLSLHIGDVVWVLEKHETGWWGGHKEGEDIMGWFPDKMVRQAGRPGDVYEGGPRCSMSSLPDPTRTLDLRAVASPQAVGVRRMPNSQDQKLQEEKLELAESKARLEMELASEKQRREAAEAKSAQLMQDNAALTRQHEQEQEAHKNAVLVERQQWERRVADIEQSCKEEARRLQTELRRKEAELEHQRSMSRMSVNEDSSIAGGSVTVEPQQQHQPPRGGTAVGRAPSAEISRRLFAHQPGTGSGESLTTGQRTPPVAMATAPLMSASVAASSMAGPQAAPLSSRCHSQGPGQPLSRQSPRAGAAAAQGLQWMQAGPPPSPHHMYRPFEAGVRSLVSEFERRSNSKGAPATRTADPSPSRQYVMSAPVASTSATAVAVRARPSAGNANIRAASREDIVHYGAPVVSTPSGQPCGQPCGQREESPAPAFNFGMSPMPRQQVQHAIPGGRGGMAASSPSAQPSVSVQDRIRQFNPQQAQWSSGSLQGFSSMR